MAPHRAIDWILSDYTAGPPKVGDLLSTEPGGMPIYQVTAVEQGRVVLAAEDDAVVCPSSLDALRWRGRGG